METLPVELGLGLLWDVALWKFGLVVGQQTFNTQTWKSRPCADKDGHYDL